MPGSLWWGQRGTAVALSFSGQEGMCDLVRRREIGCGEDHNNSRTERTCRYTCRTVDRVGDESSCKFLMR